MTLVKNNFLFFCLYKIHLISAEEYKSAGVDLLMIKNWWNLDKNERYTKWFRCSKHFWPSIYKTKSLTKKQIKRYKMTKREIFEKFDKLSEDN